MAWGDKRVRAQAVCLLAALALAGCSPGALDQSAAVAEPRAAPARPLRIVSLNLCTDQLLLQLVERDRIRALTYLAIDPRSSGMVAEAQGLPITRGVAEEVIAMQPDLVVAGTFSARETVAILTRLGYPVVTFEPEDSFEGIIANIRQMAAAVGEPARGEAMVARIEAALAAVPPAPANRPVYANYNANGFTSGDGALITEVANRAGFDTLGQRLGFAGTRQVPLEQLLTLRPDVIDLGEEYPTPALATEHFRHPALVRLMQESDVISMPSKYTVCGSELTLRALGAFVAAREAL